MTRMSLIRLALTFALSIALLQKPRPALTPSANHRSMKIDLSCATSVSATASVTRDEGHIYSSLAHSKESDAASHHAVAAQHSLNELHSPSPSPLRRRRRQHRHANEQSPLYDPLLTGEFESDAHESPLTRELHRPVFHSSSASKVAAHRAGQSQSLTNQRTHSLTQAHDSLEHQQQLINCFDRALVHWRRIKSDHDSQLTQYQSHLQRQGRSVVHLHLYGTLSPERNEPLHTLMLHSTVREEQLHELSLIDQTFASQFELLKFEFMWYKAQYKRAELQIQTAKQIDEWTGRSIAKTIHAWKRHVASQINLGWRHENDQSTDASTSTLISPSTDAASAPHAHSTSQSNAQVLAVAHRFHLVRDKADLVELKDALLIFRQSTLNYAGRLVVLLLNWVQVMWHIEPQMSLSGHLLVHQFNALMQSSARSISSGSDADDALLKARRDMLSKMTDPVYVEWLHKAERLNRLSRFAYRQYQALLLKQTQSGGEEFYTFNSVRMKMQLQDDLHRIGMSMDEADQPSEADEFDIEAVFAAATAAAAARSLPPPSSSAASN